MTVKAFTSALLQIIHSTLRLFHNIVLIKLSFILAHTLLILLQTLISLERVQEKINFCKFSSEVKCVASKMELKNYFTRKIRKIFKYPDENDRAKVGKLHSNCEILCSSEIYIELIKNI